ncbi:MAG: hypothetical protein M1812_001466 [Candelaria pacifica]|nr:MAG: hypothetical protein M1812_001466 [Candelaria pacifica]
MGFLKHIRSKSKIKTEGNSASQIHNQYATSPARQGPQGLAARLPINVLELLFSIICPHTLDKSYMPSENSMVEDGCMLCDMRDLAHCAQVSRRWSEPAQKLLYKSIRIDAVHYCELEIELAEKRKRRSFFEHNADPKDIPKLRLEFLQKTVRDNNLLAVKVQLLKMPYMTRESCKTELARTVSVLPNLQYVDLPDGFFSDDGSSHILKQELQARCPDIRKMTYNTGSEESFALLAQRRHWQGLEIVELSRLNVEPSTLLRVLASLPTLHELKITELPWLDDAVFQPTSTLPPFPPLQRLILEETPNVTANGLATYLQRPETREALSSLTLTTTGVTPSALHLILTNAPHLTHLSITETVTRSFPLTPIPPLTSPSLKTLFYEITSSPHAHGLQKPAESYYDYLTRSLLTSSLPTLRSLYVRDPTFADSLILAPPAPFFASTSTTSTRQQGFAQSLEVYSKGLDELEWNFTCISPPSAPGRRGSASVTRPLSLYRMSGSGLSSPWGGDARRSVVVPNGFGGFLAVPTEEGGSLQGKGHKREGSRQDLWR